MLGRTIGLAGWVGVTLLSLGVAPRVHAEGDAALGEKKFYTCYGCHGIIDYRNAYPDYSVPELRHQHALYIVAALHEYKSGERPHPTMHAQASSLSEQDMQDIAAYLQGPMPVKPSTSESGKPPAQVAVCAACHGENGLGVAAPLDPKPPVLAGQHADYLEQALTAYKSGRRKNVVMNGMAQSLKTDEDVRIAAEWFAHQPSPLRTATEDSK
ncbi:MAG TPA: c-type cytochrome [Steroidobacteraceae bacterium]|nr:c-type cytochrome [Steroidobacteraceae bacterium]